MTADPRAPSRDRRRRAAAFRVVGDREYAPKNHQEQIGQLELRFKRDVERLHRLGARPLYELLIEIGAAHLIRDDIDRRVARYAALDPELVRAVGGDRFAPAPLRQVHP